METQWVQKKKSSKESLFLIAKRIRKGGRLVREKFVDDNHCSPAKYCKKNWLPLHIAAKSSVELRLPLSLGCDEAHQLTSQGGVGEG